MKKIVSTEEIAPGNVIRIYKKGYGYASVNVIDNNEYFWAALVTNDLSDHVAVGDSVEAYLWHENTASYEMALTVTGLISVPRSIIVFQHTDQLLRTTGRKCLTAQVALPVQFFTFSPHDEPRGISAEAIHSIQGMIILLSDREAAMKCSQELAESHFMKGHIHLNNEAVELIAKISSLNPEKHIYNLSFTGMPERAHEQLLNYVFSIYRE